MRNRIVLITGGTGSLGQYIVSWLLKKNPKKIIVFSRDEHKQVKMERTLDNKRVRFFLGDIRDRDRLRLAFKGIDDIIHCAALKHVPKCEYDPFEAVKTNIIGAQNIIDVAITHNIKRVLAISTDKAVAPINLYGATKLCADRMFIAAGSYAGKPKFSVIRLGNLTGSRGSVVPLFEQLKTSGDALPITDKRMTRFFISPEDACNYIFQALSIMRGGEIFIPKMPSIKITDLAKSISPDSKLKEIGIRTGEKLNEDLIVNADARHTYDCGDYYVTYSNSTGYPGDPVPYDFEYTSDNNTEWVKHL